jgi:TonB-dependent SusC/RagA subfamily outer membrane receptor
MNKIIHISLAALLLAGASAFNLEAQEQYASSPADLILGTVSGVRISSIDGNPDGLRNVNIRGTNTFRGNSQPVWVIDGVVLGTDLVRNLEGFWQWGEESYSAPVNNIPFLNPAEIESIEILKDVSASALYGALGANGVIVINTKRAKEADPLVYVNTNWGINNTALAHNHSVGVSKLVSNTAYRFSGYYRHNGAMVDNSGSDQFSINVNLESKANPYVWFGVNTIASVGQIASPGTTAYFGKPSTMLIQRYPDFFAGDTTEGWNTDFDDDSKDYRAISSAFLTLNFTPAIRLHTTVGIDFEDNRRTIWYGNGTSFGAASNGAASSLSSVLFNYNVKSELTWKRYFNQTHLLNLALAGEVVGTQDRFNTMNGLDFFNHDLRAKGIGAAGSHPQLHRFAHNYLHYGTYVRAQYLYKDKYCVDGFMRADFTPRFRDAQPVLYPGVNAWAQLDKFRVTAGWGISGREYYIPYELTSSWLRSDYPAVEEGAESFYQSMSELRSSEFNAGVETKLWKDRITLAAKFYNKSTKDSFNMYCFGIKGEILWNYDIRKDVLFRSGSLRNRGLEFDLNADVMENEKGKLTVFSTAAYNINQITNISREDMRGLNIGSGSFVNVSVIGHQVGEIFGYTTDASGKFVDITADGKVTEADRIILGNVIPELTGSLGANYSIGKFSCKMLWDYAAGYSVINMNKMLVDGATDVSDKYVEKAGFMRFARLGAEYKIDPKLLRIKSIKECSVCASAANLLSLSSYSGGNSDVNSFGVSVLSGGVDYGSYPLVRTFILGVNVKF